MLLSHFPFTANSERGATLHYTAFDYSHADLYGSCDHLRNVPGEDIFTLMLLLLLLNFVSGSLLELLYISLLINIMSSLTHLLGFQLL